MVLYVNLIKHDILLAKLLALLASPINTYVSVHAVAGLKVIDLLSHVTLLLYHVVLLIGRSAHIVPNQIASVVDQLLLSLLLSTVNVGPLCYSLSLSILMHVNFIRLVRCNTFLVVLHVH